MYKRVWINADGLRCFEGSELIDDDGCWLDEMEYNEDDFQRDYPQSEPQTTKTDKPHGGVIINDPRCYPNNYHDEPQPKPEYSMSRAMQIADDIVAGRWKYDGPPIGLDTLCEVDNIVRDRGYRWNVSSQKWVKTTPILERLKSLAIRMAKPLPCLSVWAGMTATFFWNSLKNLPDQPFEGILDLPDGTPEQAIAAGLQTAVFMLWVCCFRSTIRSAIRKEFSEGASH